MRNSKLYNNALIGFLLLVLFAASLSDAYTLYVTFAGNETTGTVEYTQRHGSGKSTRIYSIYTYTDHEETRHNVSVVSRPRFKGIKSGDTVTINYLPSNPARFAIYSPTLFFMPALFLMAAASLLIIPKVAKRKKPAQKTSSPSRI